MNNVISSEKPLFTCHRCHNRYLIPRRLWEGKVIEDTILQKLPNLLPTFSQLQHCYHAHKTNDCKTYYYIAQLFSTDQCFEALCAWFLSFSFVGSSTFPSQILETLVPNINFPTNLWTNHNTITSLNQGNDAGLSIGYVNYK